MIAAFVNFSSSLHWILKQNKNTVIFCSGWQNSFSLEDSVFAGALVESLLQSGKYQLIGDEAFIAFELWKSAQPDYSRFLERGSHYKRLISYYPEDEIKYCFSMDKSTNVIVLENDMLVDITRRKD